MLINIYDDNEFKKLSHFLSSFDFNSHFCKNRSKPAEAYFLILLYDYSIISFASYSKPYSVLICLIIFSYFKFCLITYLILKEVRNTLSNYSFKIPYTLTLIYFSFCYNSFSSLIFRKGNFPSRFSI